MRSAGKIELARSDAIINEHHLCELMPQLKHTTTTCDVANLRASPRVALRVKVCASEQSSESETRTRSSKGMSIGNSQVCHSSPALSPPFIASLSSRTGIQLSLYIMYLHLPPPSPLTVVSWIYVFTWLFTFSSLLSPSLSPTELGPLNASPPQVCVAVNSRVAITKRNHKLDLLKRAKTLEDRVKWKDGVS